MPPKLPRSTNHATSLRPSTVSRTIGLAVFGTVLAANTARGEGLFVSHARELLAIDPAAVTHLLQVARPPAVSPERKAMILKSLPHEGEIVVLNASSREKLAALSPVLRALQRDGVYDIKVVDVPQAAIGIHARAVVLISGSALDLLDAKELAAAATHEAALICDAIAVFTLHGLGLDASALMRGFEKMIRFNARRLGTPTNEANYPSLTERRRFALEVQDWIVGGSGPRRAVRAR